MTPDGPTVAAMPPVPSAAAAQNCVAAAASGPSPSGSPRPAPHRPPACARRAPGPVRLRRRPLRCRAPPAGAPSRRPATGRRPGRARRTYCAPHRTARRSGRAGCRPVRTARAPRRSAAWSRRRPCCAPTAVPRARGSRHPPSPTGSIGLPAAEASTTSAMASRSDRTGSARACCGTPSIEAVTAPGPTGPPGTCTTRRTCPSVDALGTAVIGGCAAAPGAAANVNTAASTRSAADLLHRISGDDDIVPVTPGCVVERAAARHEPQ